MSNSALPFLSSRSSIAVDIYVYVTYRGRVAQAVCCRTGFSPFLTVGYNPTMSKEAQAELILKLYDLRREETMRKARDWYFREFNPESFSDIKAALFGEH